jgi:hypothetical protein
MQNLYARYHSIITNFGKNGAVKNHVLLEGMEGILTAYSASDG